MRVCSARSDFIHSPGSTWGGGCHCFIVTRTKLDSFETNLVKATISQLKTGILFHVDVADGLMVLCYSTFIDECETITDVDYMAAYHKDFFYKSWPAFKCLV